MSEIDRQGTCLTDFFRINHVLNELEASVELYKIAQKSALGIIVPNSYKQLYLDSGSQIGLNCWTLMMSR